LTGSYAVLSTDGKLSVIGMQINPYGPAYSAQQNYDPKRTRGLLLKAKEIDFLKSKITTQNLTIVPLSVYTKGTLVKMKIGLAKGRKQHNKKELIKNRDVDRDISRQLRQRKF
jgi:SsrA-binding protein